MYSEYHGVKKSQTTRPFRLPLSIMAEVERGAKSGGISINQFVARAVAETIAAMNAAALFAERRESADF